MKNRLTLLTLFFILAPVAIAHAYGGGPSASITGLSPGTSVDASTTVTFYVSTTGFFGPKFSVSDAFSASGSTVGTIDPSGSFTWTPTIFDAGNHAITVTVTDQVNNSATAVVNVFVRNNSVVIRSLAPGATVAFGRTVTLNIVAPGFASPSYYAYGDAPTLNTATTSTAGAFSWKPTADDQGTHVLTFNASDNYGHNGSASIALTIIDPKPTLSPNPLPAFYVANAGTFSVISKMNQPTYTVTDSFTGTSTIQSNAIDSSGSFHWTPTASDIGSHSLTITGTDTFGNVGSTTAMVSVAAASFAPPPTPSPGSPTTPPGSTSGYVFTTNLRIGSRGTAVTNLQIKLTSLGYLSASPTGYFGLKTAAAVKAFQKAHGLAQVGFVGPGTRKALNAL